jgi:hypothetical protein
VTASTTFYVVPTGGATTGLCPAADPCTLATALNYSNATMLVNGQTVVIDLAPGTYADADYTIDTSNGAAPVSVELLGGGSGPGATVLDGGGTTQLLVIDGIDYPVTVENLTLQNGQLHTGSGANLSASTTGSGSVTLDDDVISNGSGFNGTAVELTAGPLTINNTTVEDAPGGGVGVDAAGSTLLVNDSTLTGNSIAISVGGSVSLGLDNSTLAGNSEGVVSVSTGVLNVLASTISNGSSGVDALAGGAIHLFHDVLASNDGADCTGTVTDDNDNVVDDGSCGFTATANAQGSEEFSTSQIGLLPLANNGGPTETERITSSSAAFDNVPNGFLSCGFDQRGIPYIQGAATDCDAGAYQVAPPTLSGVTPSSAEPGVALSLSGTNLLYATASFGTGDVAGTLSAPGLTSLTLGVPALTTGSQPITVTNADGSATIAFSLAGPTIPSTSLPAGEVDAAYSHAITVTGGADPLSWSIVAGSLPPGLTLSSSGMITGTPTIASARTVTVKVTDADGAYSTAALVLSVLAPQLKIVSTRVKLEHTGVTVTLSCRTAACSGTLSLKRTIHEKVKHGQKTVERTKTTTLASRSYTLAAGASGRVTLRLTAIGKATQKVASKRALQTMLHATLKGGITTTAKVKAS